MLRQSLLDDPPLLALIGLRNGVVLSTLLRGVLAVGHRALFGG